ncbi:MAG: ABC transporter substrate-binding protein [Thermomicrobiales bacterium]|nr:ABC transporter substrate-binding protein [Thermomicrobiales bacterium]
MVKFSRSFAAMRGFVLIAVLLSAVTTGAFSLRADAQESSPTASSRTEYPLTIENCGVDLTLSKVPERVVVMEPSVLSTVAAIGALDSVVARIGLYPGEYFNAEINDAIAQIPELVSEQTSVGGAAISLETVLDLQPDLIIGYDTETITRDGLARFGIPLYVIPSYCVAPSAVSDEPSPPSFASVYDELRVYGQMFDRMDAAEAAVQVQEQQVDAVLGQPVSSGERAVALFVASDGSAIYTYSRLGMVDVQMTALGFTNVYADLPERSPEISIESLIEGDPEVLILLYTDTSKTPEEITSLVTDLPGADAISAIRDGRVYPLLFNFSEPPSPLTVEGLSRLAELLAE